MDTDGIRLRAGSLLRRAGLGSAPRPAIAVVAVVCVLLVAFALWRFWPSGAVEDFSLEGVVEQQEPAGAGQAGDGSAGEGEPQSADGTATPSGSELVVDVEGAVVSPGVYRLDPGARVGDAVDAAGGMKSNAAPASLNLAEPARDGTQIYVPTKREAAAGAQPADAGTRAPFAGAVQGGGSEAGKVNLNTADSSELQTLTGIGEALAQRIVDYREANGGFSSIEELKNVSGIGDVRYEALKDGVCV